MYLEWGKSIWGNVKGWELHIMEEAEEVFREEHYPRQRLVTQALSQHHPTVKSHFWSLVSAQAHTCQVQVMVNSSPVIQLSLEMYNHILNTFTVSLTSTLCFQWWRNEILAKINKWIKLRQNVSTAAAIYTQRSRQSLSDTENLN